MLHMTLSYPLYSILYLLLCYSATTSLVMGVAVPFGMTK
jgi:hypothetical protein